MFPLGTEVLLEFRALKAIGKNQCAGKMKVVSVGLPGSKNFKRKIYSTPLTPVQVIEVF